MTEIPADQASLFGILRRPQVDSDQVHEVRRDQYTTGMIGRLGLNTALTRCVRTTAGAVWVVPGNGFICLDAGGMCCNTTEVARAQGLVTWASAQSNDDTIVHGLVPDGVEEVGLTATNGTTQTVLVRDNVYGAEMHGVVTSLRLVGTKGAVELGPWR